MSFRYTQLWDDLRAPTHQKHFWVRNEPYGFTDPRNQLKSQQMRPPSERTTPTLGVEFSGFFPPVTSRSAKRVADGGPKGAQRQSLTCLSWVCAVTRRRFPVGANPTRQPLQPEAIGAVMEATKWLKPSISVSRIGDSASVQAVTRVNAEQSSKRTMRRPTRQPFRGRLIRLGEAERRVRPAAAPG